MDYSFQLQTLIDLHQLVIDNLVNIEKGLQFVMYVVTAFLLWQLVVIIYKLFGGVFFGGV